MLQVFLLISSCNYFYRIWLFPGLIHLSGDIEKHPGPTKEFFETLSIGHWNLDSLVAHNFT